MYINITVTCVRYWRKVEMQRKRVCPIDTYTVTYTVIHTYMHYACTRVG